MHCPFAQQPFGHEVASQMQLPDAQRVPATQAAELPQRQVPVTPSHAFDTVPEHDAHAAPPTPQVEGDDDMQTPLAQQP
jgi:hypothetical protein